MCDIKFWKDNENLRYVFKKPFFEILSGFFHFWPFKVSKSSMSLLRDENDFSLNRSNGASKNPSFPSNIKNVYMTLVKSAPKKVLAKKLFYKLKICLSPKKIGFLGQTFFGCTFYKGHMYIFEISMKRRIFWHPIRPTKKKSFHLIVGSVCTVYELKSPKWKQPLNISETVFYNGLRISLPFKIFMSDICASKSLVPSTYRYCYAIELLICRTWVHVTWDGG
jgi:hypothetical protein